MLATLQKSRMVLLIITYSELIDELIVIRSHICS